MIVTEEHTGIDTTDPALMSDTELADAVLAADRERSLAEARELVLLGEFDARGVGNADGAVNTKVWLTNRADVTGPTASLMVCDARKLRRHPLSRDACATVGTARVREVLRRVIARTEAEFTNNEPVLLETISRFSVDDTIRFAVAWARMVDTDGAEPAVDQPDMGMGVTGNGLHGRFSLYDDDAAFFAAAIDDEVDRIYRGEDPDNHQLAGVRRAQAMVNLVRKAMGADDTTTSPGRPTVIVHMTLDQLLGRASGAAQADPYRIPLPDETVRRLLCDANLHRFITGPQGVVINLGRSERLVKGYQRLALIARDRHCGFPGCDRPPSMCHAHHIDHWETGGPTDLTNLVLLCHLHHRTVHERGFGCVRQRDGQLRFTRPNGTTLEPKPKPG